MSIIQSMTWLCNILFLSYPRFASFDNSNILLLNCTAQCDANLFLFQKLHNMQNCEKNYFYFESCWKNSVDLTVHIRLNRSVKRKFLWLNVGGIWIKIFFECAPHFTPRQIMMNLNILYENEHRSSWKRRECKNTITAIYIDARGCK